MERKPKLFIPLPFLTSCDTRLRWLYNEPKVSHRKQRIWVRMTSRQEKGVDYYSIPETERIEYNIPPVSEIEDALHNWKEQKNLSGYANCGKKPKEDVAVIAETLQELKDTGFVSYYNFLKSKYPLQKVTKLKKSAQKMAVLEYIKGNYDGKPRKWQEAYNRVMGESRSYHSFCVNIISKLSKGEDTESLCLDTRGKQVGKCHKRTHEQMALLQAIYVMPQKYSPAQAHKKLVTACESIAQRPMSVGNVKIIFKEFDSNIELYAQRYGAKEAKKKMPYADLLPALHINSQWQIDGWTLPFFIADAGKLVIVAVVDNHSKKVVGYSAGVSENTALIMEALENAVRSTGFLPFELVCDKHSFHRTEVAKQFRIQTESIGTHWTVTMNPQAKSLVETRNKYLDAICKDFDGYIGKGITAKGKDARVSQERFAELLQSKNVHTIDEVKAIATYIVKIYNETPLNSLGKVSPNNQYAASNAEKAFAITEEERVKLFRPVSKRKVTRGEIVIKLGVTTHKFKLPAGLFEKYNDRHLTVVYEDLEQGIYIFDPKTGEALGTVTPKQKIAGALADQTETDKKLFLKHTGSQKGIESKASKKNNAATNALLNNASVIDQLISNYAIPKDIRKEAEQSRDLRFLLGEDGVNLNMIPIREVKPIKAANEGKTKESPFAPSNHSIRKLTTEEILGINA